MIQYRKYGKYKNSGIEWIGEVPENWKVLNLKRISRIKRGASPRPIDDPIYFDEKGKYSWVRISDVTASKMYLTESEEKLSDLGANLSVKLNPGQLFISICATVGKPCITTIKCCIHDGFVYFPDFKGDNRFLYYIFNAGEAYKGLGKLGTQLNLNTDTVGSIVVGLPDFHEQAKIADFLDQKTIEINGLIADKEKLVDLLQEKRQAIISEAVTKGLNHKVKMKDSEVDWIGEIPEHWVMKRIKHISKLISKGTTPSTIGQELLESGEVRFLKAENIQDNLISYSPEFFINEETNLLLKRSQLYENDILFVIAGATIGKVAILKRFFLPANTNQAVSFIRLKRVENTKFTWYWFQSNMIKKYILLMAVQSAQPNLSMGDLGNLPITYPPSEEQDEIINYLDGKITDIDVLISDIYSQIKKMKEYRQSLISEAITGKIDVRDLISN